MTVIFDGREFAKEKEEKLQKRVELLKTKGITPKLVSIVVGDIDGAMKYQEMKKRAGERVGVTVEIREKKEEIRLSELKLEIESLNQDTSVHGIMIQLPLPLNFSNEDRTTVINAIDSKKDVDGMREDSKFIAPVVKAVIEAIEIASSPAKPDPHNDIICAVVGAKGFEGRKMVKELERLGYRVKGLDKDYERRTMNDELTSADCIISCTGVVGLITGDMVKDGVVAIDVGAPKEDFDFESVSKKASFITPVPGGIGPVTISCLMENIVDAAS
jgi:methylenetetrahydrofolate dehydrogenase (NADP+) / methenyltetrahydrofolate cyclohydrolase